MTPPSTSSGAARRSSSTRLSCRRTKLGKLLRMLVLRLS
uniref:Uncharacterized protein n=1 Tax=Arundo donax TaxID=35708 RepID=A0A0A9HDL4_ARUDO